MKYQNRFLMLPLAACLAFFATVTSSRGVDMFLDIEGEISGESLDTTHKDEIDVLAWSWGGTNSGSFHVGGGGGGVKASFQDISITKYVDKASATLLLFLANGNHFTKATLTVRKPGGTQLEYIIITMENVLVTSVSTGGSGGEDRLTESITLNFEKVEFKYTEEKEGGAANVVKEFKWDIGENEPK